MSKVKIAIRSRPGSFDATRVDDSLVVDREHVFEMDAATWAAYRAFRKQEHAWNVMLGQMAGYYASPDVDALLITKA